MKVYRHYCALWVFGDRRRIPELMNSMIDQLRYAFARDWKTPYLDIRYIYENTTTDSKLRRFITSFVLDRCGSRTFEEQYRHLWPKEALYDIMKEAWPVRHSKRKTHTEFVEMDLSAFYCDEPEEPATDEDCDESVGSAREVNSGT